jgi:hypothetical protein
MVAGNPQEVNHERTFFLRTVRRGVEAERQILP